MTVIRGDTAHRRVNETEKAPRREGVWGGDGQRLKKLTSTEEQKLDTSDPGGECMKWLKKRFPKTYGRVTRIRKAKAWIKKKAGTGAYSARPQCELPTLIHTCSATVRSLLMRVASSH